MKRCFSVALILALLGTFAVSPAMAEDLEIIGEEVEAAVEEVGELDLFEFPEQSVEEAAQQPLADADEEMMESVVASNSAPTGVAGSTKATGIALSAKSITIGLKEKYKGLKVISQPDGSEVPVVHWRSSNKKYVKVSSSGVITGVKKGSATVYARMSGSKVEVKCKVTVKKAPKKIKVNPSSVTLGIGMTEQLTPHVSSSSKRASGAFTYKSSDKSVATVDSNGLITAKKAGSATITVKSYNGKKAKCKVKVKADPASVAFPDSVIPVAVGQKISLSADAVTKSGEVTPSTITYSIEPDSPDPGCITLNATTGKVKGVRKGTAIVCGTAHNGAVGYCEVEVDVAPAAIDLNTDSVSIGVKEVYVGLLAELTPPSGEISCSQSVTWSSSNKKIAKVNATTGAVTGVKTGSCTITATAAGGKTAKCKVKVLKAPTKKKIEISPAVGSLNVGENGKYKVTFSKGYGGSLSYSSSNEAVATIDSAGIVSAIAPGKVTITVTTYNDVKKTASLEVYGNSSSSGSESDGSKSGNDEKIQYVIKVAKSKEGKPYVYGSFGPNSFDCSGFMYWCFKQVNIKLKDSAYKQGYDSRYPKIAYGDLQPGDLVFFDTVKDKDLSDHSGLYIGNGKFIHASSSAKKVIISKLTSGYYKRNFSWGRRVFN